MINLVLNKMEETSQSNTLDWSSLVMIILHFGVQKRGFEQK